MLCAYKCAIIESMKGLRIHPKIEDKDLDKLISFATKKGPIGITFVTPHNKSTIIMLEVSKRPKGYSRVLINTYSCNWDISSKGQKTFVKYERNLPDPDDRKEIFCGKRIMRIDVKKTGEGIILAYMLNFLEDEKNLEEVKL